MQCTHVQTFKTQQSVYILKCACIHHNRPIHVHVHNVRATCPHAEHNLTAKSTLWAAFQVFQYYYFFEMNFNEMQLDYS